jgi:plastocyanin
MLVLALAFAALVVVPGTSSGGTSKVKAAGSAGSYRWDPATRKIAKGDRVVWKNPTSADHTVTAYGGGWDKNARLDPGDSVKVKFGKSGTYLYRCKLHSTLSDGVCSGMCGKVKVN